MLHSMTAFGRSTRTMEAGEVSCEIRSVNHRYLDIGVRLPDSLRAAETGIREELSRVLSRGKVDVFLKTSDGQSGATVLDVNEALLRQLAQAAGGVETMTGAQCVVDSVRLLQWPGVVGVSAEQQGEMALHARQAFDDALTDFIATRRREGRMMEDMLLQRNEQLRTLLGSLRVRRPQVVQRQRDKMQARLLELSVDHDESRLEQELVHAAQRLDIDEELDRLSAHVIELEHVLKRDEPVGRRLDFLMQEFNRECNTIGSKSADSQTTAMVVDMKVLMEQMREQIQNIE